ncbi:unnamed protein product [Spirodela intermedia]|uniref:Uncharacterized protein n=1 Tax=Spirodela intermedia TaxID=51605 RepID=A0A7I8JF56_SPIIN|nr:unnamed protein product [Spirodela intermedia]CAA6668786.1 unnamed protein product [Spirodela intermedia]
MTLLYPLRLQIGSRFGWRPHAGGRLCISTHVRSSLPFPPEKAKYHRELEAAVDAVERACRLCVDVKKTLVSGEGRFLEKKDQTPVTVADFGVQALISLELSKSFPSIPMVAEEDSSFLRSSSSGSQEDGDSDGLVGAVLRAVSGKASCDEQPLTSDIVLAAIDRGGKHAFSLDEKPATYWVLDPIDGTRGFLKGNDALYVVGLALVVEGDVALGSWAAQTGKIISSSGRGMIMVAHVGCGTWSREFLASSGIIAGVLEGWKKCSVDPCSLINQASFCIPESQTWRSLLLSTSSYGLSDDAGGAGSEHEVTLLKVCCGSLCKYLMVASGRASVFVLRARVRTRIKAWDHVAGVVCIHEAGGKVTDWKGHHLDLAIDPSERRIISPSGGILVTNGHLHQQLLSLISPSASSPV